MAKPLKLKLRKYIKFRKERGYVLLCDCKHIENYELPLSYYSSLIALKKGFAKNKIKDKLIGDLIKIKAVNKTKN